ncbi:MAG: hypothetical protein HUU34_06050 [Saprospiraceae bacterium]|nr:hypothetical protein [Saprospiraceae bacterium]
MYYTGLIKLEMHVQVKHLKDCFQIVYDLIHSVGLNEAIGWRLPSSAKPKKGDLGKKLNEFTNQEEKEGSAYIDLENESTFFISHVGIRDWMINLNIYVRELRGEAIADQIQKGKSTCNFLLQKGILISAKLDQLGGGVDCVPKIPLLGRTGRLVLTSIEEVTEMYEHPDVFWNLPWDSKDVFGSKILLTRCLDKTGNVELLKAILDQQWALSRAAKPGLTQYFDPAPRDNEMQIYKSSGPFLQQVGYVEKENLLEFSCLLGENDHIAGWEIFNIMLLLDEQALPDGRPLETIRVVFFKKEMAEREKRPLLDVGAKVFYQHESGDIIEINE